MAFKTFAPGVLTSSDVNTFLMRQAVITCTSTTRPASPSEGMVIFETNTDLLRVWDGGAWVDAASFIAGDFTTYTPTITGTGTTAGAISVTGRHQRIGDVIFVNARITLAADTVIGSDVSVSVPVNGTGGFMQLLNCSYLDTSLGVLYQGEAQTDSATSFLLKTPRPGIDAEQDSVNVSTNAPFTWTTGDVIRVHGFYERSA